MPNSLLPSVLPVLRNLPSDHPREPLLPGLKRRPATPLPLLFVLLFAVVAIVFVVIAASKPAATPTRQTTKGRVTQVERIGANVPANAQQSFIKYRFMVGNDLIYGSEIARSQEIIPDVGDKIEISYLADAPQDNYRVATDNAGAIANGIPRFALIIFSAVFFVIWLSFMVSIFSPITPRDWMNWRRARDLYRNGEVTAGRVQFVRPNAAFRSPNNMGSYEIVATYKVEGVRLLVVTRCNNAWLVNQLAPEVEVVVAYDPLRPERAVILEPFAF